MIASLTESQARKKWCPFVQVSSAGTDFRTPSNRTVDDKKCLASDCMAWRIQELSPAGPDQKGWCGRVGAGV